MSVRSCRSLTAMDGMAWHGMREADKKITPRRGGDCSNLWIGMEEKHSQKNVVFPCFWDRIRTVLPQLYVPQRLACLYTSDTTGASCPLT